MPKQGKRFSSNDESYVKRGWLSEQSVVSLGEGQGDTMWKAQLIWSSIGL